MAFCCQDQGAPRCSLAGLKKFLALPSIPIMWYWLALADSIYLTSKVGRREILNLNHSFFLLSNRLLVLRV